jgi:hypothetical protein
MMHSEVSMMMIDDGDAGDDDGGGDDGDDGGGGGGGDDDDGDDDAPFAISFSLGAPCRIAHVPNAETTVGETSMICNYSYRVGESLEAHIILDNDK